MAVDDKTNGRFDKYRERLRQDYERNTYRRN